MRGTRRSGLRVLEEAYTAARYLLRTYERGDAAEVAELADKLLTLLEKVEEYVFGKHWPRSKDSSR